MSEVTMKRCDVFGTTKDVKTFLIGVKEVGSCDPPGGTAVNQVEVDLSPRGLKRLEKAINRALTPTKAGQIDDGSAE